ncbi:response regulator [Altericista sp. CCNU0014]|uniref:response regulator n=1 Tax=Altericista sp. CCNU0014 TaxID=3082949 RepID=UPI00385119B2
MATKRVLIIDDEEAIQTVVQFGVQMAAGWEVLVACTGPQGIQIAQSEAIDAILLDVMMPGMDGIATFQALQTHSKTAQIPVIFMTAKAQRSEASHFNALGMRGTIAKPFNALDLPHLIAAILHWELEP